MRYIPGRVRLTQRSSGNTWTVTSPNQIGEIIDSYYPGNWHVQNLPGGTYQTWDDNGTVEEWDMTDITGGTK